MTSQEDADIAGAAWVMTLMWRSRPTVDPYRATAVEMDHIQDVQRNGRRAEYHMIEVLTNIYGEPKVYEVLGKAREASYVEQGRIRAEKLAGEKVTG